MQGRAGAAGAFRQLHTTELHATGGTNMQSVLERNDLDELMAMVRGEGGYSGDVNTTCTVGARVSMACRWHVAAMLCKGQCTDVHTVRLLTQLTDTAPKHS